LFYKKESIARHERMLAFSHNIEEYTKKALAFCNNDDFENGIKILEALTEHGLPVYNDIEDSKRFQDALTGLADAWKLVMNCNKLPSQQIPEYLEMFGVAHESATDFGYDTNILYNNFKI
jgi:hypothetical protein